MIGKGGYIYIVSNTSRSVFYFGVTSNLFSRAYEHKYGEGSSFTKRYNCNDLIYYEFHESIDGAIKREKQIKKWKRVWKEELILSVNPSMKDLFNEVEEMQ